MLSLMAEDPTPGEEGKDTKTPAAQSPEKAPFDPFSDAAQAEFNKKKASSSAHDFLDPKKVAEITESVKSSLVTIRQIGRDGEPRATGSGFVISEEGLVVTNLHVIGDGRPLQVEFANGDRFEVTQVYATDRHFDLAILHLERKKGGYAALKMGDSDQVKQGDFTLGFGTPRGLSFSVVPGVISAIRKLEPGFVGGGDTPKFPMLQLAMPIEQGNSGGPVVNLKGEVVGIVTLRHRVTENLGFAVPSNDLSVLLEKPNPVAMSRWTTIGTLDPRSWSTVMGGEWTQRGGVIKARLMGDGFGGRALCISSLEVPEEPYEVSVRVKLDEEEGAAGLIFASNGDMVHYGFYPTGGKLRLTRFEGADIYSWTVLDQLKVPASYQKNDWNRLRVRVEKRKLIAWVNQDKVLEIEDAELRGGKVGLCKFRMPGAEFRDFRLGSDLEEKALTVDEKKTLNEALTLFSAAKGTHEIPKALEADGEKSRRFIHEEVDGLERRIEQLRHLEGLVHRADVERELLQALSQRSGRIDLFEVGLQIARIDDPDLDLDYYRAIFAGLVKDSAAWLEKKVPEGSSKERVEALRDFLFKENGFHGSRGEYYHHANSYVNHVLDDREGLPITLAVLFVELARRLSIPDVHGIALPGKFMVGWESKEDEKAESVFFDVFEGGASCTREEAERATFDLTGTKAEDKAFLPAEPKEIAVRMLRNLVDIEINRRQEPEQAVDYLELLLAIQPDAGYERFQRAILRVQSSDLQGAREDFDWLLTHRPPGLDYTRLEEFRAMLDRRE